MENDQARVRAKLRQRQVRPVAMRIAASLVYFQLRRGIARNDDELDRAFNDAALALAQLADVYYENHEGRILRIPDRDLRSGLFYEGARTFKSTSGHEYRVLSMRRIDVMHAIEVLGDANEAVKAMKQISRAEGGTPPRHDHPSESP